jgi:two-component system cell cycle sensor histidine kinase/response regulator CckA
MSTRILFIEDSADDVMLALASLRRDGVVFEEAVAGTAAELAAALDDGPWSAVISDYNLGGFTGLEALRLVRSRDAAVPFVLLSGTIGEERAAEAIRHGANDYVMKDRIERLSAVLRRELDAATSREERRRLEESLRRAEERYRLTFEQGPVGIANADREGRFISVNSRFCSLLGYTKEEILGRSFADFSHPDDAGPALESYRELLAGAHTALRYDRRYIRKDGAVVWVNVALSPMRGATGEIEYVIGHIEDVTEQKAAEEAARHSADELREHKLQLAEAEEIAHIGSWSHDFITGRRYWSEELCNVAGVRGTPSVEELYELIHPDDRAHFRELRETLLRDLEPLKTELRIIHATGERTVSLRCRTVRNEQGQPLKIVGVVQDITDIKTAEQELRRRAILQSAVANLGHVALSGASVDFLLEQAAVSLRDVLDVDLSEIMQKNEGGFVLRAGAGWHESEIGIQKPGMSSQAAYTIAAAQPVIVEDIAAEERFVPSALLVKKEMVSGLTVAISSGDGTPWGVLGVHARRRRAFTAYEIDFLRSVATVLGQAVDRAASDAEVRTRSRQQSAIASLGRLLLTSLDDNMLDHACELLRVGVDADFAFLNELIGGATLRHRAGRFWYEGLPREIPVRASVQAGLTILSGEPVVVDDYRTEERFETYDFTVPHGILSGVIVPIAGAAQTFGILSVQSRTARKFRAEDVDFVQAIANMLAEAMERETSRAAVLESVARARRAMNEREHVTRSLELLLESTVEGIYTIDLEGRCTMVNRAAAAFLGLAPHELLGERVHGLLHPLKADGTPLPEEECAVHDVLRSGEPRTINNDVFRRKDGVLIPVAYSAAPIIDGDKRVGAVITFTDLTERRKLEMKLEQANRLSSLGRLAATVAHEFNNVLMGIAPFVEVVRRAPAPEKVAAALDHIGASVKRGRRITEDILRFTQPAEPVRCGVAVDTWLGSVVTEARSLLPPQYEVIVDAQPLVVEADANQLHQIFTNLILNARDAMPRGGTIRIEVRRERDDATFSFGHLAKNPGSYAHFLVSDTGCGIDEETLHHIFEPLFTTKKNGTGLGLAVTHQVVQLHGGEIFVESTEGAGTTFHIFLPLSATHPAVVVPEAAGELPQDRGSRRILLVEDDPSVAAGLTALLECEGFRVTRASTGNEALLALRRTTPDAVILDVGLPDMDGQRVYASIAATHPSLPVIFSTGHADRSQFGELLVRPNVEYLLKPYEGEALMDALARVLDPAA